MKAKAGDKIRILKDSPLIAPLKKNDIVEVVQMSDTYAIVALGLYDWYIPDSLYEVCTSVSNEPKVKHVAEVCEFRGSWNFPYDPDIDDIEDWKFR